MGFGRCVMRWWKSVAVVAVGAIASGLVAAFGSLEIQIGFSSGLVGCVAGLLVDSQTTQKELELQQKDLLESLEIPTAIAKRSRLYAEFLAIRRDFIAAPPGLDSREHEMRCCNRVSSHLIPGP